MVYEPAITKIRLNFWLLVSPYVLDFQPANSSTSATNEGCWHLTPRPEVRGIRVPSRPKSPNAARDRVSLRAERWREGTAAPHKNWSACASRDSGCGFANTFQRQVPLYGLPPQHRHPLRRSPRCPVPAASRRPRLTIRRPGSASHNSALSPERLLPVTLTAVLLPGPQQQQCSARANPQASFTPSVGTSRVGV